MTQYFNTETRGKFRNDWLDSKHTFSFGQFHDPKRTGFRDLLVINEDRVAPGGGFATHGHHDMEIITYVLDGALGHKDSIGHESVIRPGEIQRMSAGTGIRHSEMNGSDEKAVHFLQIWIKSNKSGHAPSYEQIELAEDVGKNGFTAIATPQGGNGAISLNQDAALSVAKPQFGETIDVKLASGRHGFLHIVNGDVEIAGKTYHAGDGLGFAAGDAPNSLSARTDAEVLLFDLV